MILEITSLHLNVAETDLQRLFTPFGEIVSIEILRDPLNNRSRGKATIHMPVNKEAQQAAASLNGVRISGKPISVTIMASSGDDEIKRGIL